MLTNKQANKLPAKVHITSSGVHWNQISRFRTRDSTRIRCTVDEFAFAGTGTARGAPAESFNTKMRRDALTNGNL